MGSLNVNFEEANPDVERGSKAGIHIYLSFTRQPPCLWLMGMEL